jgi:uncharacterized membrane protein
MSDGPAKWGGVRRAATALRVAAIALVLLSPLLPAVSTPSDATSVVYVVDQSPSIGALDLVSAEVHVRQTFLAASERESAQAGLVVAGVRPDVRVPVGGVLSNQPLFAPDTRDGTDLAAAIRLAAASLPEEGARRIVLMTDGRDTRGDALAEVERQRLRGITVDVVPMGAEVPEHLTLGSVRAVQERLVEGEPMEVVAELSGPPGSTGLVTWTLDGEASQTEWVTIDEDGAAEIRYLQPDADSGVHVVEARLDAQQAGKEMPAGSKSGGAVTLVSGNPRALVLTLAGERPSLLVDALEQSDVSVEVQALDETEITASRLSAYELVILSDVPVAREGEVTLLAGISTAGQRELLTYVRERGGGLFVTGGAFGFSPEYAGTPLSRMLPVEVEDAGDIEDPDVALAIMLDRSGSMGALVGTHTKLQLAIEAALASASTLRPSDRVGIASVDVVTNWHAPLAPAAELLGSRERIRSMALGGGGIYVYTSLVDAYAALTSADEPIRHVILFSDTADSEEQWQGCPFAPCPADAHYAVDLARTGREAGITTSVVGIGRPEDSDVAFLRDLAAAGGGRFYLTSRGTELRRIFVAETRATARSNHREESTSVHPADPHPALTGIDLASAPEILGYAETNRRPTADTALVAPDGRPLLASWRYGLGTVVALTTDAGGRWTESWGAWSGGGQLFRQLGRYAMRRRAPAFADAQVSVREGTIELEVELPEDSRSEPGTVDLFALEADGTEKTVEITLSRVAPGLYRGRARANTDYVLARIRDDHGQLLAEAVGFEDAQSEREELGPDELRLEAIATAGGGRVDPSAAEVLRAAPDRAPSVMALWPLALLLAALLVVFDLWLRRLGRRPRRHLRDLVPARAAGFSSEKRA